MLAGVGAPRKVATSIALEVALYFGWWYDIAFWLATVGLFVWKGEFRGFPDCSVSAVAWLLTMAVDVHPASLALQRCWRIPESKASQGWS